MACGEPGGVSPGRWKLTTTRGGAAGVSILGGGANGGGRNDSAIGSSRRKLLGMAKCRAGAGTKGGGGFSNWGATTGVDA